MSFKPFTLKLAGELKSFTSPIIMGILNVTPDSFYDGEWNEKEDYLHRAERMLKAGASILDIGGQSTRPGATRLTVEDEWARLEGKIKAIHQAFPEAIISIDTFFGTIAERAIGEGAQIINDVSAGSIDSSIIDMAAKLRTPYVLMHMQGEPQTMQAHPKYDDVVQEILFFFSKKMKDLEAMGLNDILVDPGFGFGKTLEHNFELIKHLKSFEILEKPVLVGISRKKLVQKVIEKEAKDALHGTSALNTIALLNGASILRVHDVEAAADVLAIARFYQK